MEPITVRTATLDDLNTLLEFEQGIIHAERPFDPTLKEGHINYYDLGELIVSPDAEVIVAVSGNEIVGSGYALIVDSKPYLKHPQHAYLGFMYVKPEYRGQGIVQTVIKALQQWSGSRGIREFRLEVYADNAPAIRAYEKIGFVKHMVEMRKEASPSNQAAMEQITTRPATINDLDILLDFEQALIIALRPFDPTLKREQTYYYNIEKLIESPDVEIVVVTLGDEIIGCGYVRIDASKPYLKHQQQAYFGFMYVKPEYRGLGANKMVMEALQKWSISKGLTEFRLEAYDENLPAIMAYEKIGFARHMEEMRMDQ